MQRQLLWGAAVSSLFVLGASNQVQAQLANGGFEIGGALATPDNAVAWDWTPDANGERVNVLTNTPGDFGNGGVGAPVILPYAGNWFGYAENGAGNQLSGEVGQANVLIPPSTPILEFYWRFFTNESPGGGNTFNDRFRVSVEGSTTVSAVVADVNTTPMVGGPVFSPLGAPGQAQGFGLHTANWAYYALDVSALAGETVTVYFRVNDVGAEHNQSSGFGLDNIQLVPEPACIGLLALAAPGLLRRRRR